MQAPSAKPQLRSAVVGARGFTLLELLAGVALFALLSAIVLSGIRLGVRSWDAAAAKTSASEEVRVVHTLLRRQLAGALPLASTRAGSWVLQFEGDARSINFVSEFPAYVAGGGAQAVRLSARERHEEIQLVLEWVALHAPEDAPPEDDAVLVRNLKKVEFSYFGSVDNNVAPRWRDEWSGVRQLPELVKVSITGGDGARWPALVVPLPVNTVRFFKNPQHGTADPYASELEEEAGDS